MMVQDFILFSVTIVSYLIAIKVVNLNLKATQPPRRWLAVGCGFIAVIIHAGLLHQKIDVGIGQNLSAANLLSLAAWLTCLLALLAGLSRPMYHLKIILYSLALLSILLMMLFPGQQIVHTAHNTKQLIHILLSTAAFSIFYLAGFQAILLALQEYYLHHRKLHYLLRALPALETMETILFQSLTMGFILLTGVLISSMCFFYTMLNPLLLQKMVVTLLAWFIFAILLIGRIWYGWRGQIAVRWTISGVLLVTGVYFSSHLFAA